MFGLPTAGGKLLYCDFKERATEVCREMKYLKYLSGNIVSIARRGYLTLRLGGGHDSGSAREIRTYRRLCGRYLRTCIVGTASLGRITGTITHSAKYIEYTL